MVRRDKGLKTDKNAFSAPRKRHDQREFISRPAVILCICARACVCLKDGDFGKGLFAGRVVGLLKKDEGCGCFACCY